MRLVFALLAFTHILSAAAVDGLPIHYSAHGKGPKTVIFVHGWTCDETSWDAQAGALADAYRVVTVDLPGHGKSGSPASGKLSMDLFARAVESVRAEVKADRVVLAGHSMGTPVVVQYARLYPRHVSALVFVDGLITVGKNGFKMPPLTGPEGRKSREQMVKGMFSAATTPSMQTKISDMMLATSENTANAAGGAMGDPTIWKDDVLDFPILGLYADKSRLRNDEYMKAHFPNMQYNEIPGTGHFLMIEKPEEFNRLLIAFLKQQKF